MKKTEREKKSKLEGNRVLVGRFESELEKSSVY